MAVRVGRILMAMAAMNLAPICLAQSNQSTWGTVVTSPSAPQPKVALSGPSQQNGPKLGPVQGEPTPATPLEPSPAEQPNRESNMPTPLGEPADTALQLMTPPSGTNQAPIYDSNLIVGPGGYAAVPDNQTWGPVIGPYPGAIPGSSSLLGSAGAWPGSTPVIPNATGMPQARVCTPQMTGPFPRMRRLCQAGMCRVINSPQWMRGNAWGEPAGDWGCPPTCFATAPWFYGGPEYMHGWTRGMTVPSLNTTSPAGTPVNEAGVLGAPNTTSLLGPGRLDPQDNAGGRIRFGAFLDPRRCNSAELEYFLLDGSRFQHSESSPEDHAILARPYLNSNTGLQDTELYGYPGMFEGSVTVVGETDFQGGGIMLRRNLGCGMAGNLPGGRCGTYLATCASGIDRGCGWLGNRLGCLPDWGFVAMRTDALVGWRAYELDESLSISTARTAIDSTGPLPLGTTTEVLDSVTTTNTFNGLVLGTDTDWLSGNWGIASRLRVSLGDLRRYATIGGQRRETTPDVGTVSYQGGLQALASNIGTYADNQFVAVPEVGFDWYYMLRPNARLKLGYTFIYLPDVWRPGTVMDTAIDPRLIPPPTVAAADHPVFIARSDDFWAQGMNLGIEWRY